MRSDTQATVPRQTLDWFIVTPVTNYLTNGRLIPYTVCVCVFLTGFLFFTFVSFISIIYQTIFHK